MKSASSKCPKLEAVIKVGYVSRHEVGVENAEVRSMKYAGYFEEDLPNVALRPVYLVRIANDSLRSARYRLIVDSEAVQRETHESILLAAQAGAAFFRASYESDEQFDHVVKNPITLPSTAPGSDHTVHAWLDSLWCSLICRERKLSAIMCNTPTSTLRQAKSDADDYIFLWADALKAFLQAEDDVYQKILAAMDATDPSRLRNSNPEIVLIRYPSQMKTLFHLASRDVEQFNSSLREAVELHKEFWSAEGRAQDPEGFMALPLTGMAAVAHDLGMPVEVESDYLPINLVNGTWRT